MDNRLLELIESRSKSLGLAALGFTEADFLNLTYNSLIQRKKLGYNSNMQFTYRNPERSSNPKLIMQDAKTIVAIAYSYAEASDRSYSELSRIPEKGVVAKYSRRPIYAQLNDALKELVDLIKDNGYKAISVADSNLLADREVSWRSGIGWYGKNSNILIDGIGSWVVLGSIITDADFGANTEPMDDGCGSCTKCIEYCPTGAIVAPGVVDANKCIAWLVQSPDDIPIEFRSSIGTRLYGCDECQEVCPPNIVYIQSQKPSVSKTSPMETLDLYYLLQASNQEILDKCDSWYIPKRDPDFIRRTALVALGNTKIINNDKAKSLLTKYLRSSNIMLRRHAVWAARTQGFIDLLQDKIIIEDPLLQDELNYDL